VAVRGAATLWSVVQHIEAEALPKFATTISVFVLCAISPNQLTVNFYQLGATIGVIILL
jgi:hypothetical protein